MAYMRPVAIERNFLIRMEAGVYREKFLSSTLRKTFEAAQTDFFSTERGIYRKNDLSDPLFYDQRGTDRQFFCIYPVLPWKQGIYRGYCGETGYSGAIFLYIPRSPRNCNPFVPNRAGLAAAPDTPPAHQDFRRSASCQNIAYCRDKPGNKAYRLRLSHYILLPFAGLPACHSIHITAKAEYSHNSLAG